LAACRVVHMMAPPPKRELGRERKKFVSPDGEVTFRQFGSPWTRLAIWRMEAEIVASHLEQFGIESCPLPERVHDPDGFLLPEFSAVDVTHANAAYGALVLEQLEAMMASAGKVQTTKKAQS